jgi:hypothetical protein
MKQTNMKKEGGDVFERVGTNFGVQPSCPHRFISASQALFYMTDFLLRHLTTIVQTFPFTLEEPVLPALGRSYQDPTKYKTTTSFCLEKQKPQDE